MTEDWLAAMRAVDTPTICNAIEAVEGARRGTGFTRRPVVAADPALPPMVGYARTARVRAAEPPDLAPDRVRAMRLEYYEYVAGGGPTVVAIEDADWPRPVGAFWGEVNVAIHKGFGVAGAITNGLVRDLGMLDPGFQILASAVGPSHAFVHLIEFDCPVNVFGLDVRPGDLVHADRHGAVVVDPATAPRLPEGIDLVLRKEKPVLDAARGPDFSIEKLRQAWGAAEEVH